MESEAEIRPKFKHVQPSGRGTQSEYELQAKRAAVESIERRFEHNERVRKSASRKRALANFGSIVVGLAVLAGLAYYFTHRNGGSIGVPNLGVDFGTIAKTVREAIPTADVPVDKVESESRDRYASVASSFAKGELASWKDAPKELNPRYAPKGTVYYALVPNGGMYTLYELKANGAVVELSPFGDPLPMTMNDFKKAVGDKPYFIACEGRVFVCGGGNLRMMDELRKALLPR